MATLRCRQRLTENFSDLLRVELYLAGIQVRIRAPPGNPKTRRAGAWPVRLNISGSAWRGCGSRRGGYWAGFHPPATCPKGISRLAEGLVRRFLWPEVEQTACPNSRTHSKLR